MFLVPDKFFHITGQGQLESYTTVVRRLMRDPSVAREASTADTIVSNFSGPSLYSVMDPEITSQLTLAYDEPGELDFFMIVMGVWSNVYGYWTTDEQDAKLVHASWQRGCKFGAEQISARIRQQLEPNDKR